MRANALHTLSPQSESRRLGRFGLRLGLLARGAALGLVGRLRCGGRNRLGGSQHGGLLLGLVGGRLARRTRARARARLGLRRLGLLLRLVVVVPVGVGPVLVAGVVALLGDVLVRDAGPVDAGLPVGLRRLGREQLLLADHRGLLRVALAPAAAVAALATLREVTKQLT